MQQLLKFLHLGKRDRQLLINTALLLGIIRLGLRLLPFQTLLKILARIMQTPSQYKTNESYIRKVVWAVDVVSRRMPGQVKCLAKALTTQVLLKQQGYSAQLRIGVAKTSLGELEAHAWVEGEGKVIIGGLHNLAHFTPLPSLEVTRS